jgi:CRP/FNR family cyclic AMP-dependent transcriptional regulator
MKPSPTVVTSAFARGARIGRGGPPRGMSARWAAALAQVPLFSGLGRRQLRALARIAEQVRVQPGATVVYRTHAGEAVFVILEGSAVVHTPTGEERRLVEGDYFGEIAVIDGRPRSAAVRAETELEVMVIGWRPFLQLMEDEPSVARAVMVQLAGRVRELEAATPRT